MSAPKFLKKEYSNNGCVPDNEMARIYKLTDLILSACKRVTVVVVYVRVSCVVVYVRVSCVVVYVRVSCVVVYVRVSCVVVYVRVSCVVVYVRVSCVITTDTNGLWIVKYSFKHSETAVITAMVNLLYIQT